MKIVAITGAGIGAESGIPTFRGARGLWEGHRLEEVASPEAWIRDPELVLRFYNMRRRVVAEAQPNAAHIALAKLEDRHELTIITQNIDDLHERGESSHVIHLHGEIMKARSTCGAESILPWGARDILAGDLCSQGGQLRPHVVWFGEEVTEFARAIPIVYQADLLLIVGTSLQVYPAASLVEFGCPGVPIYVVNPDRDVCSVAAGANIRYFVEPATQAVPRIVEALLTNERLT